MAVGVVSLLLFRLTMATNWEASLVSLNFFERLHDFSQQHPNFTNFLDGDNNSDELLKPLCLYHRQKVQLKFKTRLQCPNMYGTLPAEMFGGSACFMK